jgi:hypothetical protein
VVALTGRRLGKAAIYIDGEHAGTVQLGADHRPRPELVFRAALSSGAHDLTVRVLTEGRAVRIESFAVLRGK